MTAERTPYRGFEVLASIGDRQSVALLERDAQAEFCRSRFDVPPLVLPLLGTDGALDVDAAIGLQETSLLSVSRTRMCGQVADATAAAEPGPRGRRR